MSSSLLMVCGISRTGKTSTLAKSGLNADGIEIVRASAILKKLGYPLFSLTIQQVAKNQTALAKWLHKRLKADGHVVLDGHLLLATAEGPYLVPDSFFLGMPVCGILLIRDKEASILERRSWKSNMSSIDDVETLASMERLHASRLARVLDVPFAAVRSQDTSALKRHAKSMFHI